VNLIIGGHDFHSEICVGVLKLVTHSDVMRAVIFSCLYQC
jgi:hypothetical protein